MKQYKNRFEMIEVKNGKFNIVDYSRKMNIVDDDGSIEQIDYVVCFSFPKEMAKKELERLVKAQVRKDGTEKIEVA
jgi:hypothetical protein